MNCYVHPDRETEETCANCGRPICAECKVMLMGKGYCKACTEKLFQMALTQREPGWFERHLNWTFALSLIAVFIIMLHAYIITGNLYPDMTDESFIGVLQAVWYIARFIIVFPVAMWVVRKKARSPWNIFWLLLPFGEIMLFLLGNMSKQQNSVNKPRTA